MSRKKSTSSPAEPHDAEEFGDSALSRKQVLEVVRKKDSLDEADLRGTDLSGICFDGMSLAFAKFGEANLSRSSFKGADLRGASFFSANLKDVCLDGANLEDADLDYAQLDGVTLHNAKIRKALFPTKRLSLADVRASVATGVRLRMDAYSPTEDED